MSQPKPVRGALAPLASGSCGLAIAFSAAFLSIALCDHNPAYPQQEAGRPANEYISLRTAEKGEDIRNILNVIAKQAGINVLIDKSVAGRVPIAFKDLLYENALREVAKLKNADVVRDGNIFMIGNEKKLAEMMNRSISPVAQQQGTGEISFPDASSFLSMRTAASGEDIRLVLKTLAINAGKELLFDKSVCGKITVALRDVDFESAVRDISYVNGLDIRKVDGKYLVGAENNLSGNIDMKNFSSEVPGVSLKVDIPARAGASAGAPLPPPLPLRVSFVAGCENKKTAVMSLSGKTFILSAGVAEETSVFKVLEVNDNGVRIFDAQTGRERVIAIQ